MADEVNQKLLRLIELLIEQTNSDNITWEKRGTFDDEAEHYDYSTSNATAQIYTDGNQHHYPSFSVKNSDGAPIGSLEVTETSSTDFDAPIFALLDAVRRKVLKIDATLDDLIADLERRSPF